jgi:zinc-ribbon domain
MTDYPQRVNNSFNERMRLIRLRRKKENLQFWTEFKLIPKWIIGAVIFLYGVAQVIAYVANMEEARHGQIFPPDLHDNPALASLALAGIVTLVAICFASFIFLIVYVNRDAKRRGMSSALWTILVLISLPSWGLIGLIVYLLMREPLPYPCPVCAASVSARFNFCPNCKCNLQPSCPRCKNEVAELDKFCPYCGNDLTSQNNSLATPAAE